jgi:hypothetical protein
MENNMTRIRYAKQLNGEIKSTKPVLVGTNLVDIIITPQNLVRFQLANTEVEAFPAIVCDTSNEARKLAKEFLVTNGVVFDKETRTHKHEDLAVETGTTSSGDESVAS